jgi:hypothetical protein
MALFEGTVGVRETSKGLTISRKIGGDFSSDNAKALLDAIVKTKKAVNMYSLWIDGKTIEAKSGKYTAAQIKSLADEDPNVELVLVRKPFPQPKLKITFGEGSTQKRSDAWVL